MKTIAGAAAILFLLIIVLTVGCTKEGLTGSAVKAAEGSFGGNVSGSSGEENEEGCIVDAGILDRVFSGHGWL